jgi:MFS family permease
MRPFRGHFLPRRTVLQRTVASRKLSRNVYIFGITSFLNDTASEMAYWVLPAFLTSIGAGPAKLGIIEGVAESVASLAKLFSGFLADRSKKRKPIVVFGYAVANAVKPLLALTTVWWEVLFIRFFDRSAKGIRGAPRDVMVAESTASDEIGSAYGLIQAMDTAGAIVGPLLALALIGFGYRTIFWAAAVPGALCIIFISIWLREPAERKGAKRDVEFTLRPQLPGRFYYILTAVLIFSLGNSSDMFLVLRAQNLGIAAKYAPLLGLVFNVTYTAISWPAGKLSDRSSRYVIAALGYLVFAVVYFIFAEAPSHLAIWLAMSFYGLFYALTSPVLRALVVDSVPHDHRGRAFGVFYFSTSVATLLASLITGELWKYESPAVPFYLSAGLAALAALMLLFAGAKYGHRVREEIERR